jgi:hypothetical protein
MMEKGKWLRKLVVSLVVTIALLLISLTTIVVVYKDDIISKAVASIQENLKTKSSYSSIDISIWSSFPLLGVEMKDIYIEDAFAKGDTLLYAKKFALAFDWLDALSGSYSISKILVDNAQLNFIKDKQGKNNWEVLKEISAESNFQLGLKKMRFKSTDIVYWDARSDFFQSSNFKDLQLKGNFSTEQIYLEVNTDAILEDLYMDGKTYVHNISWQWDGEVMYDPTRQYLEIAQGDWEILDSPISITGWLDFKQGLGHGQWTSESISAEKWIGAMPAWISGPIKSYQPKGNLSINGSFNGKFANPKIQVAIKGQKGKLIEPKSGTALEDLTLQLDFEINNGKDVCTIQQLEGSLGGGKWKVSGKVSQTENPDIDLKVEVEGALSDIHDFLKWDTLENVAGRCSLNSRLVGKVQLLSDSTLDWESIKAEGNLILQNVNLGIKGLEYRLQDLNGVVQLHEGNAIIHQWVGKWGDTDFDVTGRWNHVLDYWAKGDAIMMAELNVKSHHVTVDNWIMEMNNTKTLALPYFADFNIYLNCDELEHKDFSAKDIQAHLELDRKHLQVQDFALKTANGKVSGSLNAALLKNNDVALELIAMTENLDIKKLMHEFQNFDQDVIVEEQLVGNLNADIEMHVNLAPDWKVKKETISGFLDVDITDGEILNWKILTGVADFMKRNKWISPIVDEDLLAEKLKHVRFKSLKNILTIQDGWIDIPWMEINTSALNMVLKARHSLSNEVDYLMGFHVRDLLLRDPNQKPTEDGKKFFISMRGPWNGLVFKSENDEEWKGWVNEGEVNKKTWKDKWKENLFKINPLEFVRERSDNKNDPSRLKPRLKVQPPAFLRGRKKDKSNGK